MGSAGFSQTLIMLLVGVFTIIGANMVAQPLADAYVKATASSSAGFTGQFLTMFPFLMLVGGVIAMFAASFRESRAYMEGNPSSILMRAITVIIGAVMLPVLLDQMSDVTTTYGKYICGDGSTALANKCVATSIAGESTTWTGTANPSGLNAQRFVAIGTFVSLLPLAYILSLLNVAIPQLGARVYSGVANRL